MLEKQFYSKNMVCIRRLATENSSTKSICFGRKFDLLLASGRPEDRRVKLF